MVHFPQTDHLKKESFGESSAPFSPRRRRLRLIDIPSWLVSTGETFLFFSRSFLSLFIRELQGGEGPLIIFSDFLRRYIEGENWISQELFFSRRSMGNAKNKRNTVVTVHMMIGKKGYFRAAAGIFIWSNGGGKTFFCLNLRELTSWAWAGVVRLIKKRRAVNWIEIEPMGEGWKKG